MNIYADILMIVNCILTIIYLQTLSAFTHRRLANSRLALASLLGGLLALMIGADGSSYGRAVIITLIKWAGVAVTLLVAFKFESVLSFLRCLIGYIVIRAAYTGIILIYWQLSDSKRIYVRNYTVYFDISLLKLTVGVISAYGLLTVYEAIARRYKAKSGGYKAVYKSGDYELTLPALADTGNKLCDSFTGMPVVIFCCDEMYYHYCLDDTEKSMLGGFHLTPYKTIGGMGVIAVTAGGSVSIIDDKGRKKDIKCMVGITRSREGPKAIFDPILLQ